MKFTDFNIWFSDGSYKPQKVFITALTRHQAKILAQAERIKDGLDYTVFKIEEAA